MFEEYSWILYVAKGMGVTLQFSVLSVIIGLIIGSVAGMMSLCNIKILYFLARAYVSIIRGTPLLLQLVIIYHGLPFLLHFKISVFAAGIIAFSLNSGAYITEIIRSGIMSVDKGQFEAAKSLSISYKDTMISIILPQAFRNVLPALVNEVVNLIKESAIISTIGGADLIRRATIVATQQYNYFAPMMVAAACYYFLVVVLSYFAKKLERKLNEKY